VVTKPIAYTGGRLPTKAEQIPPQDWLEKSIAVAEDLRKQGLIDSIKGALPFYILKYGPDALWIIKTDNVVIKSLLFGIRWLLNRLKNRYKIK